MAAIRNLSVCARCHETQPYGVCVFRCAACGRKTCLTCRGGIPGGGKCPENVRATSRKALCLDCLATPAKAEV